MKIYKGYQFKSAVCELVHKIARDLNCKISVTWTDQITTAGINQRGTIYLADVADDAILNHNDLVKYCGFAVHELLHRLFTDFTIYADHNYVAQLHNAVEDAFIEHKGISLNTTGNIKNLLTTLVDNMVSDSLDSVSDWADPRQYPYVLAIYLRDHATRKVPLAKGLAPIFDQAKNMLGSCQSSADTLSIAVWVFNEINKLNKPSQNPSNQATSPVKNDAKGKATPDGDSPSNRSPENGKPSIGDATAPFNDDAFSAEPTLEAPKGKAGPGSYSEDAHVCKTPHYGPGTWMDATFPIPGKLRYSVRQLFEDSGINDFQRNRKSGAINIHALPTVSFNDKVFKRRHEVEGIDTAVTIVLDVSTSMFQDAPMSIVWGMSERIITAIQTTIALMETLEKAQVAVSVVTFGRSAHILKPFDMPVKKAIAPLRSLSSGGGTNDYFAVRYAHKQLLMRPEQRKICFVLTDGEGHADKCKEQVITGEKMGITTIGVGIFHYVGNIFSQHASVCNVSDLAEVSFKQIKLAA